MKRNRVVCTFLLLLIGPLAYAQDFWQEEPYDGMGNRGRKKHIITMPAYMGPNALPVPEIKKGQVEDRAYVQTGADLHVSNGDKTQNAFLKLYYPLAAGKVAIELYGVPYEHFRFSTDMQQHRRAAESSGNAIGDLYFGTIIQLVKNKRLLPDMAFSLNCKTASGNNLENARFTDAPAYFFDVSMGKYFALDNPNFEGIRLYGTGGLYVWQTNSAVYEQDDSFLYGLGAELTYRQWQLNQVWAGYQGYIDIGDHPSVYRLQLTRQQPDVHYRLEYQAGLHHFDYNSFKVSVLFFPFRHALLAAE